MGFSQKLQLSLTFALSLKFTKRRLVDLYPKIRGDSKRMEDVNRQTMCPFRIFLLTLSSFEQIRRAGRMLYSAGKMLPSLYQFSVNFRDF